ncbi:MAG: SDR family oxidoreductase [Clostridiales Family XIII bacterium]|nr:SDR family oxidoreductase [Clostridiales Family XIII bacterium]
MKLKDKIVIVTGASAGMGKAITELFAAEGATVIALARRKDRLDELAKAAGEKGQTVIPFEADLQNQSDIDGAVKLAAEKYGRLDIVVNNAGVMDEMLPADELTDEIWDKVLGINLTALMRMTRSALKVMLAQGSGIFVNIASIGGLNGCRAGAAYAASKFGAVGFTKNVGFMYATKGIRANAICPGAVSTEIAAAGITHPSAFGLERAGAGLSLNPRSGTSEEIATVALFLASDDSSFVNGATLVADAGWSAY